ncbi:hypothetical protein GGF32_009143 [Allomyces javanicus]|nr:hypothetical protein GGF32_009143 [Allomyces javanicus]
MSAVLPPRPPSRHIIQLCAELTNPGPRLEFITSYIEETNLAIQDVAASTDPQALGVSVAEHAIFKALAAAVQCLAAPGGPVKFLRWAVQNGYFEDATIIGRDDARPSHGGSRKSHRTRAGRKGDERAGAPAPPPLPLPPQRVIVAVPLPGDVALTALVAVPLATSAVAWTLCVAVGIPLPVAFPTPFAVACCTQDILSTDDEMDLDAAPPPRAASPPPPPLPPRVPSPTPPALARHGDNSQLRWKAPAHSPVPPSPARHGDNDGQLHWKTRARAPSPPRHNHDDGDAAFARAHAFPPPSSTTGWRGPKPGLVASIATGDITYRAILGGDVPPGMPLPRISRRDDDVEDTDFVAARARTTTRSRGGQPPRVVAPAAADEMARGDEREVGPAPRATRSRRGTPARGAVAAAAAAAAAADELAREDDDGGDVGPTRTNARAPRVAKNGHDNDDRGMPAPAPRTELARLPRSKTAHAAATTAAKKPAATAKPAAAPKKPRAPRRARRAQHESLTAGGVIRIEDDVKGRVDPRTWTGPVRWVLDEKNEPPPPRGPWDELAAVEGNVQIVVDWDPDQTGRVDWEGLEGWLRVPVERRRIGAKEVGVMTVPARSARAKMALQCDGKTMGGVEYRIRTRRQFEADQALAMQADP